MRMQLPRQEDKPVSCWKPSIFFKSCELLSHHHQKCEKIEFVKISWWSLKITCNNFGAPGNDSLGCWCPFIDTHGDGFYSVLLMQITEVNQKAKHRMRISSGCCLWASLSFFIEGYLKVLLDHKNSLDSVRWGEKLMSNEVTGCCCKVTIGPWEDNWDHHPGLQGGLKANLQKEHWL